MSIYVIQPARPLVERSTLETSQCRLSVENRINQINEAKTAQNTNAIKQVINELTNYSQGTSAYSSRTEGSPFVSKGTRILGELDVIGSTIVDITEKEAELLRQALPDTVVIPNRQIELIPPLKPVTAAVKSDVDASDLWHLQAIGLESARNNGFLGSGQGVTVAVLDTGIDPTHSELQGGRVAGAFTFDKDGNAQPMTPSQDTDGHGTHVAALICGRKVGVAPGAKVLNALMIPYGTGTIVDFYNVINWAARQPEVSIVNISAGIRGYTEDLRPAIESLLAVGVLPVVAIGNEGRNRTRSPGNYIEVLAVGAASQNSRVGAISGGGTMFVNNQQYLVPDLVAPGIQVYSAVQGGYEAWDGTSMATPIVSGIAALILEKHPNLTVVELIDALLTTCKQLGGEPVERQGNGLVQVTSAL